MGFSDYTKKLGEIKQKAYDKMDINKDGKVSNEEKSIYTKAKSNGIDTKTYNNPTELAKVLQKKLAEVHSTKAAMEESIDKPIKSYEPKLSADY